MPRPVRVLAKSWWHTVPEPRTVLALAPTMACAQRVLEIIKVFEGDRRIQVLFTVPQHEFNGETEQMLRRLGAQVVPWEQAHGETYNLAIAANLKHIMDLKTPVVVFSHGASRNSWARPRSIGSIEMPPYVPGFDRSDLVRDGMVVPQALVYAHEMELALLKRGCPEAMPIAVMVGDPIYDRILTERECREEFRKSLELRDDQTLVVVTSTWRKNSLYGSGQRVIERLVHELPATAYRIVLLTHPNIWAKYGHFTMRSWNSELIKRGLTLVEPEDDWLPYLLAADWIVGDHGSTTLYGSMTGVPVLLGAFPDRDVYPRSGAAELGRTAPRIVAGTPLAIQLERAAAEFDPAAMARAAAMITTRPGQFAANARSLLYPRLGLREPSIPSQGDRRA